MSTIRFIHTADLHLDSPFKGMTGLEAKYLTSVRESTFYAFKSLIDHAIETKPDFLLIVGDIYDGENRSLRAQMKFHEGMKKLDAVGIPVFISHGNHDHLGGRWTRFDLPSNTHVFTEDVESVQLTVNGQDIVIHGFSYKERHIRDRVIDRYPIAENNEVFHIGMLHGSLAGDETHAVYAPFTKSDLLAKQYDYWALGHIHLRQQLHDVPPIVYPGNLQGRHRNEQGKKGFYEVELSKTGSSLQFVAASAIVFGRLEVSCADMSHANEWLSACSDALEIFRQQNGAGIVELVMTDIDSEAMILFDQSPEEEWLEVLRDFVGDTGPYVWIQKISFARQLNLSSASSALVQSVAGLIDGWTVDDWKDVLKDVYQHARGVKYLENLTDGEIEEVKAGANALLAAEMSGME